MNSQRYVGVEGRRNYSTLGVAAKFDVAIYTGDVDALDDMIPPTGIIGLEVDGDDLNLIFDKSSNPDDSYEVSAEEV